MSSAACLSSLAFVVVSEKASGVVPDLVFFSKIPSL
jgi:hypothetical protein